MVQRQFGEANTIHGIETSLYRKPNKARSWFKNNAKDHLAHIRDLVAILQNHGIAVRMLKTDRVGYVVYEDEFQIVAEPFTNDSY